MIKGLIITALGLLQTIWMVWAIRRDAAKDNVSLIEATILKAVQEEPLPKSNLGIAFDRILNWLGLLLGLAMVLIGLLFLIVE